MKTLEKSLISDLNTALSLQLACINQCFLHARILKHKGMMELADGEYKESIEAMKHADMIVERILALGAIPNMREIGAFEVGEHADDILANDLTLKKAVAAQLSQAIARADETATRGLLAKILHNIEEHIAYIHNQLMQLDAA